MDKKLEIQEQIRLMHAELEAKKKRAKDRFLRYRNAHRVVNKVKLTLVK